MATRHAAEIGREVLGDEQMEQACASARGEGEGMESMALERWRPVCRRVSCSGVTTSSANGISGYRDLIVWQRAVELLVEIHRLTPSLPRDERFGITAQLQRAAVSISANVAEGSGRRHRAEYAHHISIARGSALEVESLLIATVRLGMLEESSISAALGQLDQISRMLAALYRCLAQPSRRTRL